MKEGEASKALELIEKTGSTVVNYRGDDGNAGLHIAMRNRNGNWVGFLLSRNADPDLGDKNGDTPLIIAVRLSFSEGAARMLMHGAHVDKANRLGETALIVAVQQRQAAIVRMLLEAGANPDITDHASGYSARDYAKRDGRSTEMLKLIETVKAKKAAAVGPTKP
jgi:ankyrin repeat protein